MIATVVLLMVSGLAAAWRTHHEDYVGVCFCLSAYCAALVALALAAFGGAP